MENESAPAEQITMSLLGLRRYPAKLDDICGAAADDILPLGGLESNILTLAEKVGAEDGAIAPVEYSILNAIASFEPKFPEKRPSFFAISYGFLNKKRKKSGFLAQISPKLANFHVKTL